MSKKFDVVIGNPPYQEEARGEGTRDTPVYHLFMDAAYELGDKAILITPARFLYNAGFTPKAWNEKMLADPHLSVAIHEANSAKLFPGTDIKGGIAVTYRDAQNDGKPIDTFTSYPELNDILHKVKSAGFISIQEMGITSSRSFRYTEKLYEDHPEALSLRPAGNIYLINTNAFEQFHALFHEEAPADGLDYTQVFGLIKNKRFTRWIRSDYVAGPESFSTYKVAVPAANGSGAFGEVLSNPVILEPDTAVTQSFITIGSFGGNEEASACLKYVKTKFARAMLGILKSTQHNPAKVWKYVPLQDFTVKSDIDWSKQIPEIDQQLYAKYDLDKAEIAFIDSNVKPMD